MDLTKEREVMDLKENLSRERKRKRKLKQTPIKSLQLLFEETPTTFELKQAIWKLKRNIVVGAVLIIATITMLFYLVLTR